MPCMHVVSHVVVVGNVIGFSFLTTWRLLPAVWSFIDRTDRTDRSIDCT